MNTRDAITNLLFLKDEPAKVDLCCVLGSRFETTMDGAINLYRTQRAPKILITGHGPEEDQEKEADLFAAYAQAQGIPAEDILPEREARHTKDNFVLTKGIIQTALGWETIKKVAIVGKPFHMRRALMTARRFWPDHVELIMLPSNDPRDLQPDTWWQSEWGRNRVMEEVRRIGEYAAKGDLADY